MEKSTNGFNVIVKEVGTLDIQVIAEFLEKKVRERGNK